MAAARFVIASTGRRAWVARAWPSAPVRATPATQTKARRAAKPRQGALEAVREEPRHHDVAHAALVLAHGHSRGRRRSATEDVHHGGATGQRLLELLRPEQGGPALERPRAQKHPAPLVEDLHELLRVGEAHRLGCELVDVGAAVVVHHGGRLGARRRSAPRPRAPDRRRGAPPGRWPRWPGPGARRRPRWCAR